MLLCVVKNKSGWRGVLTWLVVMSHWGESSDSLLYSFSRFFWLEVVVGRVICVKVGTSQKGSPFLSFDREKKGNGE